jgi:hypothetical protein
VEEITTIGATIVIIITVIIKIKTKAIKEIQDSMGNADTVRLSDTKKRIAERRKRIM